MRRHLSWMLGLGVAAAVVVPASGHHSFAAQYDANQPVTLRGTVTKFEFRMPHSWVHLTGTDDKGSKGDWAAEFGNPNQLYRSGWTKTTLTAGMDVTIDGSRSRDGSNTVHATRIRLADGKMLLNRGAPGEGPPARQPEDQP